MRLLLDASGQLNWSPYYRRRHKEAHLECVAVNTVEPSAGKETGLPENDSSQCLHLRLPASRTVSVFLTSYATCDTCCYTSPSKPAQQSSGFHVHPHLHTTCIKEVWGHTWEKHIGLLYQWLHHIWTVNTEGDQESHLLKEQCSQTFFEYSLCQILQALSRFNSSNFTLIIC